MAAARVSAALPPIKLEQPAASQATAQTPASLRRVEPTPATPSALDLLFDASGFAAEIAQIVELGPADIATSFHLDFCNGGTVGREHAFHAFAMRNLSDRKRRVEPAVSLRDDDALVSLKALTIAFRHAHLNHHRIA